MSGSGGSHEAGGADSGSETLQVTRSTDGAHATLEATNEGLVVMIGSERDRIAWNVVEVSDIVEQGDEWSDHSSQEYSLTVSSGDLRFSAEETGVEGRASLDGFRAAAQAGGATRG